MMKVLFAATAAVVFLSVALLPAVYAEPAVLIKLEKSVYGYCEKLFYVIEVSEVTGDPAIIHIRDDAGKGSSAIPIPIVALENPVPSLVPFEKEVFPLGKYYIDVEYSGQKTMAEFELIDLEKKCFPNAVNIFIMEWHYGKIPDGFLIDAFQKQVDKELIRIPFEITENNIYSVKIPSWVKDSTGWWLEGMITDEELANMMNYLMKEKIISNSAETGNNI